MNDPDTIIEEIKNSRLEYRVRATNRWGPGPWLWPYHIVEAVYPPKKVNNINVSIETQKPGRAKF